MQNISLTDDVYRFVIDKVESGRYQNASDVIPAALQTLAREEQQHDSTMAALQTAMDEGDQSGIAEDDVFGRVRQLLTPSK
jgi:antitoxin ParD1/3/4